MVGKTKSLTQRYSTAFGSTLNPLNLYFETVLYRAALDLFFEFDLENQIIRHIHRLFLLTHTQDNSILLQTVGQLSQKRTHPGSVSALLARKQHCLLTH
jgi:hypothetical protein